MQEVQYVLSFAEVWCPTFVGALLTACALVCMLTWGSVRIERAVKSRYRNKVVCTGKMWRSGRRIMADGNLDPRHRKLADELSNPDLVELRLANGARTLVPVSPFMRGVIRVGDPPPLSVSWGARRNAVSEIV